MHLLGGGSTYDARPVGSSRTTVTGTATRTPSTGLSTAGKPSATPTRTAAPTPTATPTPTVTKKPSPAPSRTTPPPPPAPHYPLLVLNNSAVSRLGTAAAAQFQRGGWTIAGVGNLLGRIKDTTVYYSPGYKASALALAHQFPQLHRVLARIPGLPGNAKLTVVVTRYYDVGGDK
jgi:hypothetical protein